jgi:hypothetical protein
MVEYEAEYEGIKKKNGVSILYEFYDLVNAGSTLDLKKYPEWQGSHYYVYNNHLVRYDAPGNIVYGYMSEAFGINNNTAFLGAGFVQARDGNSRPEWGGPPTYGDDPYDHLMIWIGIRHYHNTH